MSDRGGPVTQPTSSVLDKSAVVSGDGLYRYTLSRRWGTGEVMAWIMLNPSTADGREDDPTIRRCMGFARREGYDGIEVLNLYALRATKPAHLLHYPEPEGPDNEKFWTMVLQDHAVGMIVAAWGAHAHDGGLPGSRAVQMWWPSGWYCLGLTKGGIPRHPLYVRGDTEFERYDGIREVVDA